MPADAEGRHVPNGFNYTLESEGATCLPKPTNGVCPKGFHIDPTSEGSRCI